MTDKILPLLSDSLRNVINTISENHDCRVAKDILKADSLNHLLENSRDWEPYMVEVFNESLNSLINDEYRMLSFRFNDFSISYLPKGEEAKYSADGIWSRENRQNMKPARLFQKLLVREYKCKEFEDFSNYLKAEIINANNFEIVSGTDITKYYNRETYYSENGMLGNSCMRYEKCASYFKVYEDHAKMLISKKDGKITGRAILWEIDGKTYMDRVYTYIDYLYESFINYAKEQNWYIRECNDLLEDGSEQYWKGPEDNYNSNIVYDLTIKLDKEYDEFPYLDSLRYYNKSNNTISTKTDNAEYCLSCTDGSYERYEDDDSVPYECACCGNTYYGENNEIPDEIVWSEYHGNYYCTECSWYCEYLDDYYPLTDKDIAVMNTKEDITWIPESHIEDSLWLEREHIVKVSDRYFFKDSPLITNIGGNYVLNTIWPNSRSRD